MRHPDLEVVEVDLAGAEWGDVHGSEAHRLDQVLMVGDAGDGWQLDAIKPDVELAIVDPSVRGGAKGQLDAIHVGIEQRSPASGMPRGAQDVDPDLGSEDMPSHEDSQVLVGAGDGVGMVGRQGLDDD